MVDKKQTFVSKLVKDPAKPPSTAALSGWAGEAAAKQHIRLYLDMELSSHVDIPEEIILNREDSQGEDPKQQQTHIWIDRANLEKLIFSNPRNPGGPGFPGGPINTTIAPLCGGPINTVFPPLCGGPSPFCPPTQQPPCGGFTSTPPLCPQPTIQPPCGFTTTGPVCPPTSQPPCGFTAVGPVCPPQTIQPPCQFTTAVGPNCPPATLQQPCGGGGQTAFGPVCPVQTLIPPCNFGTAVGPNCPPQTLQPPCGLGPTSNALCQPGPSAVDACPTAFCPPGGGFGGNFGGGGFGFNGG